MSVKEYGYEYENDIDEHIYLENKGKLCDSSVFNGIALRSGRDAFKIIAGKYNNSVLLISSLSCDSMITPFEKQGFDVFYYKLNSDLTIQFDYLLSILAKVIDKQVIFVYMDYFGINQITDNQLQLVKEKYHNVVFVKDLTHTFLYDKVKNIISDYSILSLRKWLPVPDGGVLWCKNNNDIVFGQDLSFFEKRLSAQKMRFDYLKTGKIELKPIFRKIFSNVAQIIDNDALPGKMSNYSFEILRKADFKEIKRIRERNYNVLLDILSKESKIYILQPDCQKSNLYFPIIIENRDFVQNNLSKIGIYNTIIWPLRDEQKKVCETAKYVEEHMLAVSCDQRYSIEDMKHIAYEIVRVINE